MPRAEEPLARLPPVAPAGAPCAPLPRTRARVTLTAVRGEGVAPSELSRAVALLEGRLGIQDIELDPRPTALQLGARHALGRSPADAGPALGPLASFLGEDRQGLHLVVVDGVVDPRSPLAGSIFLEGFGIAPDGPASPEVDQVRQALTPRFPVLVVDRGALEEPGGGARLLVHELGHALGLPHGEGVMEPGPHPCVDGFSASQLHRAFAPRPGVVHRPSTGQSTADAIP